MRGEEEEGGERERERERMRNLKREEGEELKTGRKGKRERERNLKREGGEGEEVEGSKLSMTQYLHFLSPFPPRPPPWLSWGTC